MDRTKPLIIAALAIALTNCACPFLVTDVEAELSDLTPCQGWNADGNAIPLPDVVSPEETRICICGYLKTNQDILLQIDWSREGSNLLRERQVFSDGPFLNCIEKQEGFEHGDYTVAVVGGKTEMGHVEFTVGEKRQ